ncbi:hypothetical protein T11_2234 [Trichinella zimbabwensis]|uniref:Uncharacterized protein n=1 Tax=Trichinella zimbabwensis TaxID=268475 RepID=A0A0V1H6P7_9BILA|nr:hypothetical protein T11_2234 [Trichinella zimbabwensis]KRZ06232.1 hypothetical protein T11_2234 [Trichinella zimbabwensis]
MQKYKDSEQSGVRTWRSLHLIHNCGKLVTEPEINSHLTWCQENGSVKSLQFIPLYCHYGRYGGTRYTSKLKMNCSRLVRTQALVVVCRNQRKRMIIYYSQRMNTLTLLHNYPLPRIEDVIRNVTIYQV